MKLKKEMFDLGYWYMFNFFTPNIVCLHMFLQENVRTGRRLGSDPEQYVAGLPIKGNDSAEVRV